MQSQSHTPIDTKQLTDAIHRFVQQASGNIIAPEIAISDDVAKLHIFSTPLLGFSTADDPLFEQLKQEEVIGNHVLLPKEWLSEARTVISFFLPFTEKIRHSNQEDILQEKPQELFSPSAGWLHGRIEGQVFVFQLCDFIANYLTQRGYQAVIPSKDPRFTAVEEAGTNPKLPAHLSFTSVGSERHAAYISGLGTFSLSRGLITEKGVCGRFGSLITDAYIPPTPRKYTGIYDYCIFCGACVKNCPAHAIDLKHGKLQQPCCDFVRHTKERFAPRYGCGKCQVAVPCESSIPMKNRYNISHIYHKNVKESHLRLSFRVFYDALFSPLHIKKGISCILPRYQYRWSFQFAQHLPRSIPYRCAGL